MVKVNNSQRLSFKLMDKKDANLLYELDQDPDVMRYINGGKISSMEEVLNVYIPRMESYTNIDKGWGLWKVRELESDSFIGWVLVRPMKFFDDNVELDNLELGWRFKQSSWGKGYATESASAIKEALITEGSITTLSALAFAENLASIKIMKKLGMKYLKTDIQKDPLGDIKVEFYEMSAFSIWWSL